MPRENPPHVFRVWAPLQPRMRLHLLHPVDRVLEMRREPEGYFALEVKEAGPGTRYFFRPGEEEGEYPDPASHFQPEGVHGPSEVVDHAGHIWSHDHWRSLPPGDRVIYELHVGTFTPEGTFEAVIPRLADLAALGINTLELMPVSQFPGARNWGYDGVFPYAPQNSYGGPAGLKKLVDACHGLGMNVILDVVYNHWGPEGNYLSRFGPYFTEEYRTPWGSAVNLDGPWCDGVREYLLGNILHGFEHYRLDGLRVDAIHTMFDKSATHFWQFARERLRRREQELGRHFALIAESDLNDPKVVRAPEAGGFGFDAQWLDDFHHALYALLDPKGHDHFEDFGSLEQLAKAYTDGFVHSGEYVSFRKRRHGASSAGVPGDRFVAFIQNHDQVGNRVGGERLSLLVDYGRLQIAAAAVLLAPYVPLLFMGEEYGEEAPFFFFADHSDRDLLHAVREGRKREFAGFHWDGGNPRDPFDPATFEASRLRWDLRASGKHNRLLAWHTALIALRRLPALRNFRKNGVRAQIIGREGLALHRKSADDAQELAGLFNFSDREAVHVLPENAAGWILQLDSRDPAWHEGGSDGARPAPEAAPVREVRLGPRSVRVYLRGEGEGHVA